MILSNIKANLLQIRADLLLILDPLKKSDLQKNKDDIAAMKTKNDALIVEYKTTITTDLDKEQFAEFEKLLGDYRIARDDLFKQVDEGNYEKANELAPALTKIRTDMFTILEKELDISYGYGKS